jgi:glycosyltransferase 2 family protein
MPFTEFQGQKWGKGRKILQGFFVIAIFIFLGRIVWENWNQVIEASLTFQLFPLILSTLIFVFSYFIQIWAWYLITLRLGIAIPFKETVESWFYSQLGKYLPGKVWLFLSRLYFYDSKGMPKKTITVALYFETVTLVMAAGLIFLISLFSFKEIQSFDFAISSLWLIPCFVLAFFFLHPKVLQIILNRILASLRRGPISISISYVEILGVLGVCLLSWMVGGIGFYFFVDSVFTVSSRHVLILTGALAISSTLGLIALFAPSGLGVREGVLVSLLSLIMPSPVAVILSVLTRLWMTFIEIGLIGVVYLVDKLKKRD